MFGLVFAGVFLLVGGWSTWKSMPIYWWPLALSGVFALVSLVAPGLLGPLNRVWTLFGALLHVVMSPVILALLYFLVFVPMGLFLRMIGKRPLSEPDTAATSYWIERDPPGPDPSTMSQQF